MLKKAKLVWDEQIQKRPARDGAQFFLDPVIGLSDIDDHPITDAGWKQMKSEGPDSVANVAAAPSVTLDQLSAALEALTTKGGYKSVEITIRNP